MRGGSAPHQVVQDMVFVWANRRASTGVSPFAIDGESLKPDEIAKPKGLLPLILWHAEGMQRFALQSELGVGVVNVSNPAALLGVEARFDAQTRPLSEVLCYVLEAMEDMATNLPRANHNNTAELRSFVNTFAEAMATLMPNADPATRLSP